MYPIVKRVCFFRGHDPLRVKSSDANKAVSVSVLVHLRVCLRFGTFACLSPLCSVCVADSWRHLHAGVQVLRRQDESGTTSARPPRTSAHGRGSRKVGAGLHRHHFGGPRRHRRRRRIPLCRDGRELLPQRLRFDQRRTCHNASVSISDAPATTPPFRPATHLPQRLRFDQRRTCHNASVSTSDAHATTPPFRSAMQLQSDQRLSWLAAVH
jgi:hypothetical protein